MKHNISRRSFLQKVAVGAAAASFPYQIGKAGASVSRPNIIFIMADDLGYGDIGCYGQKKFQTPNIDLIATEGIRFTQCYAGSTICAPSRSVLMTGQHTGHTRIRGNMCTVGGSIGYKGKQQVRRMYLTEEDQTVGNVLQKAGYKTCLIGKWHLGAYNPDAGPLDRGFDEFYGWLIRTGTTGGYYPPQRYRNRELYDVPGNENNAKSYYEPDKCTQEAIEFLKNNNNRRFFLYLAYNSPHSPLEVPDLGPYTDEDWPAHIKTYAAMVYRLDQNIRKVMQTLKELNIDEKTIVFFCSDNGPRSEPTQQLTEVADFFDSNGPLQGHKRDLYEGGIRVPMIVRWPGRVPAGKTSDFAWYFADFLSTAAELAGTETPKNIDGVSIVPVMLGKSEDLGDRFLYWEYFEKGFQQAVRWRNFKAIRLKQGEPLLLFDLSEDIGEQNNVAEKHPEVISQIEEYLKTARTESLNWPIKLES
ncbi:MAG: sulfatase [Planctomycetes bacterium RBG_13_44_8b]|nr:MAG: sulfatase [Planctomycetes bacterium RBG_13_44_8b]